MYNSNDDKDKFFQKLEEEKKNLNLDKSIIENSKSNNFEEKVETIIITDEPVVQKINGQGLYSKFKDYYYDLSHSKYYGVMSLVNRNRDNKKKLRDEFSIVQRLRTIPVLRNDDRIECDRINEILDSLIKEDGEGVVMDNMKINELIVDIESKLKLLKSCIN